MKKFLLPYVDKIVVVAGGTSGMGESLTRLVAPVARAVVVLGRSKKAGERLVNDFPKTVHFMAVEMKNIDEVQNAVASIATSNGPIDYFYNFAGTFMAGEMRDTPVADWRAIFDDNILPITHGTAAVYAHMQEHKKGTIVNVASAAGLFPVPVMNIYGATKSAVVSLTLGLRLEAQMSNIQVNVVCPTVVDTPLYDTARYDGTTKAKVLGALGRSNIQQPNEAALRILKGVAKNKAIIQTSWYTRIASAVYRWSPDIYLFFARTFLVHYRDTLRSK